MIFRLPEPEKEGFDIHALLAGHLDILEKYGPVRDGYSEIMLSVRNDAACRFPIILRDEFGTEYLYGDGLVLTVFPYFEKFRKMLPDTD